jgi:hypothetical protein
MDPPTIPENGQMTITAKYPSKCAACGGAISAGERIEWSKGTPVVHTQCPDSPAPAPARKSHRRRGTWTGCSCGSVEEYSKASDCRTCRFEAEE